MSVINTVADTAKHAVDSARNTVDQAIHDPDALREKVGEQVRDLPLLALQFTVRGVGQALVVGDRVRREFELVRESGIGPLITRVFSEDTTERPADGAPHEATPADDTPAGGPSAGGTQPPAQRPTVVPLKPQADLPVPDYDSRTVPSLRARLRGLSAADVRLLLDYEKAHAARPDVVTMYERRIAKLDAG